MEPSLLPYVIYHGGNCQDGFTAAWCAYRHFTEDGARYIPWTHNEPLPALEAGADIYFVDITPKRDALLELAKVHPLIVVLDHHKTAQADLAGIEEEARHVIVYFDMNESGATLAWGYFCGGGATPLPLLHVRDRDLWRFELPDTKAVSAALFAYEYDFSVWDSLMLEPMVYNKLRTAGAVLLQQQQKWIDLLLDEAQVGSMFTGNGNESVVIPVVNAPYFFASEVGNQLLQRYPKAPFAGVYRDTATGRRDWSLRSEDNRIDVSAVASHHGGGGHRNAAGMSEVVPYSRIDVTATCGYAEFYKKL